MNGRVGRMATMEPTPASNVAALPDYRWLLISGFYIAAALSGFAQAVSGNALVHYLPSLLMACSATGWCVVDARRRGKPWLPIVQLIALVFWLAAVPIYLIASRRWRGLGWIVLNMVMFYASFLCAFYVTYYLAHGSATF